MSKFQFHASEVDGCLYRFVEGSREPCEFVRENFRRSHMTIGSVADLKATIRAGEYTFPGGYSLYFITEDCEALSFRTVKAEFRLVADAIRRGDRSGWRVIGCDVNWDDDSLVDAHTGEQIKSEYGDGI